VVTIVADAGGPDGGAGSPDVGSRGARADRKKNGAKGGRSSLRITGGLHVTAVYWSKDVPVFPTKHEGGTILSKN
jgi:hypothetical protein